MSTQPFRVHGVSYKGCGVQLQKKKLIRNHIPIIVVIGMLKRNTMVYIKKLFDNKPLIGCEIGVFKGLHAWNILQNLNIQKLYLVDPYFLEYTHPCKAQAKLLLIPYEEKVCWIYKHSQKLTNHDISESLDFMYIDGDHSYEAVKNDLELGFKLVKSGGVVGGHDWGKFEINKAVHEFSKKHNYHLFIEKNQKAGEGTDWWIHKR